MVVLSTLDDYIQNVHNWLDTETKKEIPNANGLNMLTMLEGSFWCFTLVFKSDLEHRFGVQKFFTFEISR